MIYTTQCREQTSHKASTYAEQIQRHLHLNTPRHGVCRHGRPLPTLVPWATRAAQLVHHRTRAPPHHIQRNEAQSLRLLQPGDRCGNSAILPQKAGRWRKYSTLPAWSVGPLQTMLPPKCQCGQFKLSSWPAQATLNMSINILFWELNLGVRFSRKSFKSIPRSHKTSVPSFFGAVLAVIWSQGDSCFPSTCIKLLYFHISQDIALLLVTRLNCY